MKITFPRKILSLLLSLCLVFGSIPLTVFAGEAHEDGPAIGASGTCSHIHDADCGYIEAVDCGLGCEDEHAEDCAYTEAAPCSHEHDEDCGGLAAPVTAAVVIAKFDDLPGDIVWQEHAPGTLSGESDLILPDTLEATDTDGNRVTVKGVTWETMYGVAFDPAVEELYYYEAVLPDGYTPEFDWLQLPVISVMIGVSGNEPVVPLTAVTALAATSAVYSVTVDGVVRSANESSLSSAVGIVAAGETAIITLESGDEDTTGVYVNDGKDITLDLNGNTLNLTATGGSVLAVDGGSFKTTGGKMNITVEDDSGVYGVSALGGAVVDITGDVNVTANTGNAFGVFVDGVHGGATVKITGNIEATAANNAFGVYADNDATVTVTGNIEATANVTANGVDADNGAEVTVGGNIKATSATGNSVGVSASDGATVDVTGDIEAISDSTGGGSATGVSANGSGTDVTIKGNIKADSTSVVAYGVNAFTGATVRVTGNITAASATRSATGVSANSGTTVTVTGNVSAASAAKAFGVEARGNSTEVTVTGGVSATGGGTTADTVYGVFAANNAAVTVTRNVSASGGYAIGVKTQTTAEVTVGGNVSAAGGVPDPYENNIIVAWGVDASGGSKVTVDGSIAGVYYIVFYDAPGLSTVDKGAKDQTSSKPGYDQYSNAVGSVVWVKAASPGNNNNNDSGSSGGGGGGGGSSSNNNNNDSGSSGGGGGGGSSSNNNNGSGSSSSGGGGGGGSSSSGGGGGGSTAQSTTPPTQQQWKSAATLNTMLQQALANGQGYIQSSHNGSYGVRAAQWAQMAGMQFRHDSTGSPIQVRLYIDKPENIKGDVMVSAWTKGAAVDKTHKLFEKFYANKVQVISFDQQTPWGQKVKAAARVDLALFDTKKLYLYAYDKGKNSYKRISQPEYRIDKNGFLHFTTELAGDIIVSEGPLLRKGN